MSDIHEGVTLGDGGPSGEPLVERALEHLVDIVNRLIRREIAAAAAAASAFERLVANDSATLAREIEAGHRDRVACLPALARALSGEPATGGNLRSLFDRARHRLRVKRGDPGILDSLVAIEEKLADEYRDAIRTVGFTDNERGILEVGLAYAENAAGRLRGSLLH
jgi:hypothetical protein